MIKITTTMIAAVAREIRRRFPAGVAGGGVAAGAGEVVGEAGGVAGFAEI